MFERYILNFENSDTYALLGINPRDKFVSINGTLLREGFFINPLSQIELTIPRDSKLTDEILKLNPIVKPYDDFRTYLSLYSLFNRFDFDINDSATTKLKESKISVGMFECGILCLTNQVQNPIKKKQVQTDLVDKLRQNAAV